MKTGRRMDPDSLRRDPRDRDFSMGRIRKRPSMLSEFHGKHYNHRDPDRGGTDGPYFRPYNRYSYNQQMGGPKHDRYGPGFHKSEPLDPRRHPYAHHYSRSSFHHNQPSHHNEMHNEFTYDEEIPLKRPRLYVDVTRRASSTFDTPNSADSTISSNFGSLTPNTVQAVDSPAMSCSPPQGMGLSAYLEDIDSDDDTLLREEEEEEEEKLPPKAPGKPTKEELLQMMERVDRDIAATEGQIAALQKKQAELEESSKASIPPSPFQPSPKTPTPPLVSEDEEGSPSPLEDRRLSPKRSLADTIYAENRLKARMTQMTLNLPRLPAYTVTPLYHQPCEAPGYHDITARHQVFRPKLIEYVRKRKLKKHKQELKLCEQYDALMADWERKMDKTEGSTKRKVRDAKNRELFEKTFPELKARREQQERLTRVDQRGFGVVRSDAELKEIMYELYEQQEAPVRYRRTHATIPAMLNDEKEREIRFHTNNGLIPDPMVVYRESKLANVWTDEEKRTFREKFLSYPKNFEMIASFIPNKSTADCVKYYYLSKKNENFKTLVRKANFKRRKVFIKPQDLSLVHHHAPLGTLHHRPTPSPSMLMVTKPKPEPLLINSHDGTESLPGEQKMDVPTKGPVYGDWTEEEIASLKEGLRKYGRAWGKIYREVGGRKTATQCKQFYDDFCNDVVLDLHQALAEHSSMKNAEKARRKAESRKTIPTVIAEGKKKGPPKQKRVPLEDADSENTESASETESNSGDESESESTITDSSPEEVPPKRPQRGRKADQTGSTTSTFTSRRTSEDALDLFISAAEALSNIVPVEIALHDHTYTLPPSSLMNSVDFQGSSGLSLIAAAAAVVSPSLARSAGSGKLPVLSPVRAPRGRPPNSQKRGSGGSTSKLSPTFLSPVGSSSYVPLTDAKTTTFRSRTRSAPTDRPRSATITVPRTTSTLSRISFSSNKPKTVLPPALHSRHKETASSHSPSLKSMIASRPQHANSGNAAFEALVNVAVAAHPAELHSPRSSASTPTGGPPTLLPLQNTSTASSSSMVSSHSTPVTPVTAQPQPKEGTNPAAVIDLNQAAINILALASLGQPPPSSISPPVTMLSAQPLLTQQTPVPNFLENIMTKSNSTGSNQPAKSESPAPTSAPANVSTLLEHLTAGSTSQNGGPMTPASSTATTTKNGNLAGTKTSAPVTSSQPKQPVSTSESNNPNMVEGNSFHKLLQGNPSDDLSNLNLLSSLVAAVAASQSPVPEPKSTSNPPSATTTNGNKKSNSLERITSTSGETTSVESTTAHAIIPPHHHIASASISSENLATAVARVSEPMSHKNKEQNRTETPTEKTSAHEERGSNMLSVSRSRELSPNRAINILESPEDDIDRLPRSVVRTNPQVQISSATNDMTASLASIIPETSSLSSYPSMSQQSTLLLYTHSLSFPLSATSEPSSEEEDHLESATRGISELSKLLGTDTSTDSLNAGGENSAYKSLSTWNPADLSNPAHLCFGSGITSSKAIHSGNPLFARTEFTSEGSSKPFLSSLLESHGTIHSASTVASSTVNSTNTNSSSTTSSFTAVVESDTEHSR